MDLPDAPALPGPEVRPESRPRAPEVHSLGVWKGRGWELGLMLAAAGMLACLAL